MTGPLAGRSMSDLVSNINPKNCYVNVHGKASTGGEIRGQMTPFG